MISFFNRIGNSWIAKGIFFLLGASMMVFWGLGGISNTAGSDNTALSVAGNEVSMQELGHTFDQERNKMTRITGAYISPKQAIQAGLLDQVVQQLTLRELNAKIQDRIGLSASDNAVRNYIEKNPVFADNLGKFDANLFYSYLSGMNMSQAEFAHQMRAELANQHLLRTISAAVPKNQKLMNAAVLAQKETREIVGVLLTPKMISVAEPTLQELKDYYEAYLEEFGIPEYRTLRIVSLKADSFENNYDKMYDASRKLEDLLGAGKTLKEACSELKLKEGSLVTVDASGKDKNGKEQKELKVLLEESFGLAEGETTTLVDVEGGFIVAGVEKIIPQGYKGFDSVKNDVVQLWKTEQQKSALSKTADKVLTSVKEGKGWAGYTPVFGIVSQTNAGQFPKNVIPVLMQQKTGAEQVVSIPTETGVFVAYVKKIIPSKQAPTEAELVEAAKMWNADLLAAVQQSYTELYPVSVHQKAIQKAFSIYDKQED
ncbi:MAG: SurA N-terminal domain-containing protein [Alphaproteobacteria bacterium]|nr:SurA N-terminal domain-containing protein [Alphaproteobacteria bacterium]